MSRCDSAAIVSKTSELLPEPDTPVNTVSFRFGMSRSTFLRLFSRAPRTSMEPQWEASGDAVRYQPASRIAGTPFASLAGSGGRQYRAPMPRTSPEMQAAQVRLARTDGLARGELAEVRSLVFAAFGGTRDE